MLRTAEVVLMSALSRHETRGAHAMKEYPKRDDINFLKYTLVYYNGSAAGNYDNVISDPTITWFPVTFTRYAPVERHY